MADIRRMIMDGALNRRDLVKRGVALGLAIPAVSTILAACGGDDDDDNTSSATATTTGNAAEPTATTEILAPDLNATPTTAPAAEATGTTGGSEATATTASAPTATTAPVGKAGGKLVLARSDEADLYDPVLNDSNCVIWLMFNTYDCLVKSNDTSDDLLPAVAESWDVSDDGLTVTFNIRQGMKFFDGSDLTTDDIIWSLERARDTETSVWTFTVAQVKEFTAPDEKTVQLAMTQPWAPLLAGLAMFNGSIVSKAYFEANMTDTGAGVMGVTDTTMGTGPFAITEWKNSEYTILTKNPYYWEEGLPYVDEIKILQVADVNAGILQMQGGDVDGLIGQYSVPLNRVAELQKDSNLQVLIEPASYAGYIGFNIEKPPLNDIHFRRALNYATDVQTLIDTVAFGFAEVSHSFFPIGALYWNPDQEPYPFDLDMAKSELASSTTPTGGKVEVLYSTGDAYRETLATAIKDMWAQIGVELTLTPLDAQVSSARVKAHDFQMRLAGWTNDMIDPDEIVSYYVIPENSENARTGWFNQEANDLAIAAEAELDPEKRRQMYYQIQKIMKEDGPEIFLYNIPYVDVLSTKVKNFGQDPLGAYLFSKMYIEE